MGGRATPVTGRHKPIPGGFAAAIRAAETRDRSYPPPLWHDLMKVGNKVKKSLKLAPFYSAPNFMRPD